MGGPFVDVAAAAVLLLLGISSVGPPVPAILIWSEGRLDMLRLMMMRRSRGWGVVVVKKSEEGEKREAQGRGLLSTSPL